MCELIFCDWYYQHHVGARVKPAKMGIRNASRDLGVVGWRNEANTDRIDELRDSARRHFENEKHHAYDCIDELLHGNLGSAMREFESGWHEYCAGVSDQMLANEFEYMPDDHQDVKERYGYARRD